MDHSRLREARIAYSYVPAQLVRSNGATNISWGDLELSSWVPHKEWHSDPSQRTSHSSLQLDNFHSQLLTSDSDDDLKHGLLSVVFWGFASGKDNRIRERRALARAKWHVHGKVNDPPQDLNEVLNHLITARTFLYNSRTGDALIEITKIKYLGLAFGSKILAFMNPRIAGVYDKVISEHLANHPSADMRNMGGGTAATSKRAQASLYSNWCGWCANKAEELNSARMTWLDWNGLEQPWRAVDVERAIFSLAERD